MDEWSKGRRKLVATLTVLLPVLAGIAIVAAGHFFGHETNPHRPQAAATEPRRRAAPLPAAGGTPSPRVRLREGATGNPFDSVSLDGAPYVVVFISTRCNAIGNFFGRDVAELRERKSGAAVLAISSDPSVDSRQAVRAWLSKHHL